LEVKEEKAGQVSRWSVVRTATGETRRGEKKDWGPLSPDACGLRCTAM
jgi:hypothetical protein